MGIGRQQRGQGNDVAFEGLILTLAAVVEKGPWSWCQVWRRFTAVRKEWQDSERVRIRHCHQVQSMPRHTECPARKTHIVSKQTSEGEQ